MDNEFLRYYERELAFIREMGVEFATAHPQVAGQLRIDAGRCEDPHVERLIEAFAFLTARVRKKVDDEYPEITEALLSVVYPHYLRPVPSMAIVQLTASADPTKTVAGLPIAAGTRLTTRAVDGLPCRFRTAYPVTLWPVAIDSASLTPDRVAVAGKPAGATALLRVGLRCDAPGGWASLAGFDVLRVYLDGVEPVPSAIYEALFDDLTAAWVRGKSAAGEPKTVVLPRGAVRPVGFAEDEAMIPYPARSFLGYRLLQEFFAFPAKFLFFDLTGLGQVRDAGLVGPIELLFFLDEPPRTEVAVRPEHFRLGCTPTVNLFEAVAEPIRLTQLQTEYRVVPEVTLPLGYEVFSVDRVVSAGSYLDESVEFEPFYAMRHARRGDRPSAYWYSARRPSLREQDDGTEVDLVFTDPHFRPSSPAVETVTAYITCTNRDLPSRLPFGGDNADFLLESDAPLGRVRLLTKPTPSLRPPLGRSAQWRMISQLGLGHLSLDGAGPDHDAFRELLTLYDFARTAVTRRMIGGVLEVSSDRVAARVEHRDRSGRNLGKPLSLGLEVRVRFDEEAFAGSGAFLMACVLERFLGAYVSINSFTQMVAVSKQREGTWKRWPPRSGDRTLL